MRPLLLRFLFVSSCDFFFPFSKRKKIVLNITQCSGSFQSFITNTSADECNNPFPAYIHTHIHKYTSTYTHTHTSFPISYELVHTSEFPEIQSHQNSNHLSPAPLTTTMVFFLNYTIRCPELTGSGSGSSLLFH